MLRKIQRALISVSDKTGLVELGLFLQSIGVEIISTGGTASALREAGIEVQDVSELTGFPEILDGRVKTLHPSVHGALLACYDQPQHAKVIEEHKIKPINLVIINLYPFTQTVKNTSSYDICIENIDIGGPSMIRSAAKNHAYTTVVTRVEDYDGLKCHLQENDAHTTYEYRQQQAMNAFFLTSQYDAAIGNWFADKLGEKWPAILNVSASCQQILRYGENPHQKAALYKFVGDDQPSTLQARQLQGKELSYNNIHDTDAALHLVWEFDNPAAVIIKHANPCGVACGTDVLEAYSKALSCDPTSAFGGIIAVNREIDALAAAQMAQIFTEVIVAPSITEEARTIFAAKKNLRILTIEGFSGPRPAHNLQIKSVSGGLLIQSEDNMSIAAEELQIVTNLKPTPAQLQDLLFAFKVCKHVKSNAIVLAYKGATIGVGAGQMSRIDSVNNSIAKAKHFVSDESALQSAVLASDAFFPFPDGVITAAQNGIKAIIQPGGSIQDEEVIKAANQHNVAMVFTGIRHFKH